MNSSITFTDESVFESAVTALEVDATPMYSIDEDNLTIYSEDIDGIVDVLSDNGISEYSCYRADAEPPDGFLTDAEADADALASAGFGTDEDYGSYGYDE